QQVAAEIPFEAGAVSFKRVPINRVRQEVPRDIGAVERRRKRAALIENPSAGDVAALEAVVWNVIEVTERVGIVQRAVFAEAFDVISSLHLVQRDLLAEIRSRDEVAVSVEIDPPGVAAAFREQLKFARERVITPDALLKFGAA